MKNIKLAIICILLLSSFTTFAQVSYSRPDQVKSQAEIQGEQKVRQKEYEKQKSKMVEESISSLKDELQLDELQFIAIRQIILESVKTEGIILKKEGNDEDKIEALKALSETTDIKVKGLLTPSQIEKFNEYRNNPNTKKKKKKK